LAGATNVVGTNIVHDVLSSVQTDIAWATINPFIPKEYHNMGKQILANIMDQVTSEEIKLVSQFLQSRRSQKLTNCEVGGGNINSIKTTAYRYRKRKRLLKEMRHV
jgi:hypothetical protein